MNKTLLCAVFVIIFCVGCTKEYENKDRISQGQGPATMIATISDVEILPMENGSSEKTVILKTIELRPIIVSGNCAEKMIEITDRLSKGRRIRISIRLKHAFTDTKDGLIWHASFHTIDYIQLLNAKDEDEKDGYLSL